MESVSAKEPHSALAQSFGAFASPSPRNRRQMLASNGRLSGMIIAVTGIDARQRVEQLGGSYSRHLTTRVTHLVAGGICNSQKYNAAKELGIPVLSIEFIEMAGSSKTRIDELVREFTVRPFYRCKICITGFSAEERDEAGREVGRLGGELVCELTGGCTHLVVHPEAPVAGNPKIKYALAWGIQVVRREWLDQSVARESLLDTAQFEVQLAGDATAGVEQANPDRIAETQQRNFLEGCTVYLPNADEGLKRLVLSAGGVRLSEASASLTHCLIHDRVLNAEQIALLEQHPGVLAVLDEWLLDSHKAGQRLDETPYIVRLPASKKPIAEDSQKTDAPTPAKRVFGLRSARPAPLKGMRFVEASVRRDLIERLGGSIGATGITIVDKLVIDKPISAAKTTFWIEAIEQRGQPVLERWLHQPFVRTHRIDLSSHVICQSGFDAVERQAIRMLVAAFDGRCTETFSPKNTILVISDDRPSANQAAKIQRAHKLQIPVVRLAWLLDSVQQGGLLPIEAHAVPSEHAASALVHIKTPVRNELVRKLTVSSPLPRPEGISFETQRFQEAPLVSSILRGCVLGISHRLWHKRDEIHELALEMGGLFVWSFDVSCTHYIHQSTIENDSFDEFQRAIKSGKAVVSPHWLWRCKEERRRLPESLFPHTFNPNKRTLEPPSIPPPPAIPAIPAISAIPAGYAVDSMALPSSARSNLPRFTYDMSLPVVGGELASPQVGNGPASTAEPPRLFIFSGITAAQRSAFKYRLARLNAAVAKSAEQWDPEATHLVCARPSASEKVFAAIASGAWLLRCDYLEACHQAKAFVDEADWEWTVQDCKGDFEEKIVATYTAWRERIGRHGRRPYTDWIVLLLVDDSRKASIARVLQAGGAVVVERTAGEPLPTHLLYAGLKNKALAGVIQEGCPDAVALPADHFSEFLLKGPLS